MKVEIVYRTDNEPLTTPFPSKDGIMVRFVRGDYLDPQWIFNGGGWFKPPAPRFTLRHFFKWLPIPYIAWRKGTRVGYIGAKIYGVDSPEYYRFVHTREIYNGSQAFCITLRPFGRSL